MYTAFQALQIFLTWLLCTAHATDYSTSGICLMIQSFGTEE